MNAIDHIIGKSFDHTRPSLKTKVEEIPYTVLLGAPDERVIKETVNKYMHAGWIYAARKENEGFLSIGAHTKLTFQLPHDTQPQKRAGRKHKSCFLTLIIVCFCMVIGGFVGVMVGQDGLLLGVAVGGFLGLLLGR